MSETAPESRAPAAWGRRVAVTVGLFVAGVHVVAIALWVASGILHEGENILGWIVSPYLESPSVLACLAGVAVAIVGRRQWGTGRLIALAVFGILFLVVLLVFILVHRL